MSNATLVIIPYVLDSVVTSLFGDESVDLVREPLFSDMPEMMDELGADTSNTKQRFRLLFSASPFPRCRRERTPLRAKFIGWSRRGDKSEGEGRLCSALPRYFEATLEIYVKTEAK